VDMSATCGLAGFFYLPRQDGCTVGNVDRYAFYVSEDGKTWGEPAARGEFGNIKANPVQQTIRFARPVKGRYFKFVALGSADGDCACVAELGVFGKGIQP
jgi:alpha-L-fucosidase